MLSGNQINCKVEIPGPEVSRRYSVFFSGPGWEESVQRILRARKKDGDWVKFEVKLLGRNSAKLYLGPDKSSKTARLKGATRELAKHLQEVYSTPGNEERKFFGRNDGMVLANGKQLARTSVEPDSA